MRRSSCIILLSFIFAFSFSLNAAVINVTTTEDNVPGSLRQAISTANAASKDTTIILPAGVFYLLGAAKEDNNLSGDLDINTIGNIDIIGQGAVKTIIDGNRIDRVFDILNGNVSITGITIQRGKTPGGTPIEKKGGDGGGIRNYGDLSLIDCSINENQCGKGVEGYIYSNCPGGGGYGGGICNLGSLTMVRCQIANNIAGDCGGAIDYCYYYCEIPHGGYGGGVYNDTAGNMLLKSCTFINNKSGDGYEGGWDHELDNNGGDGGAIFNSGTQELIKCTIKSNSTGKGGMGSWSGGDEGRSGHGGGICNIGNSTLTDCSIQYNFTGKNIYVIKEGDGGGLYNGGNQTLSNCTVNNNTSGTGGHGGGIYNSNCAFLMLTNCTVSTNCSGNWDSDSDLRGGNGGGICNAGSIQLACCTICMNATGNGDIGKSLPGFGGGIYNSGLVEMKNTILANNSTPVYRNGQDFMGQLQSLGYNLVEDTKFCTIKGILTGNITDVDPCLGPLADNGGLTKTHALLQTSPAIDAGDSTGITTDQRGYSRPVDISGIPNVSDASDIGAFEYHSSSVPELTITAPTSTTNWPGGTKQLITWSATGPFNSIDIEYTTNYISEKDSVWIVLVNGAPNTGSYSWNLPNITSSTCRLWMKGWGPQGDNVAWSKIFSITASTSPAINISSPNGGEIWTAGSTQNITWTTSPTVDNVKIEYSINGGSSWNLIKSKTPDDGNYSWIVPDSCSADCLVKVTDTDNNSIFDVSNAPFTITSGNPPSISLSNTKLNFGAKVSGPCTSPQNIMINNSGGGSLDWGISDNQTWLNCTPTSGSGPGIFSVSVDPGGLTAGVYTGSITVEDANATNSPQMITVTLKIYNSTVPPFGSFDTPVQGSTVYSSVPVTGWVLDDIEVENVKIYRENGSSLVYIGDAVFVQGARSDIEKAYPDYPANNQAGWGYMMLTNFFPNGGNGTYKIRAIALDKEGLQVNLGTRTIIVDNGNAVKPFGALDTPGQGGIASGGKYINWGWALTPQPNTIPLDGSTITVWVDGVPVGNPVYNKYREDIAVLFPDYNNSSGASGYFCLDTTKYENGVHTIAWSVTDNAGNTDGIGSRYFSIQNINNDVSSTAATIGTGIGDGGFGNNCKISGFYTSYSGPLKIKKGFNLKAEGNIIHPEKDGYYELESLMAEPVSIEFPQGYNIMSCYMMEEQESGVTSVKPAGSTIKNNVFSWLPPLGFSGAYEIGFIIKTPQGNRIKTTIFITISSIKLSNQLKSHFHDLTLNPVFNGG